MFFFVYIFISLFYYLSSIFNVCTMALLQKKRSVINATEFSKLDIKSGALTYNQQYNRCTIPLLNKPYVQLQGLAEPIRSFDDAGSKSSHSISFLSETSDDFQIYAGQHTAFPRGCAR